MLGLTAAIVVIVLIFLFCFILSAALEDGEAEDNVCPDLLQLRIDRAERRMRVLEEDQIILARQVLERHELEQPRLDLQYGQRETHGHLLDQRRQIQQTRQELQRIQHRQRSAQEQQTNDLEVNQKELIQQCLIFNTLEDTADGVQSIANSHKNECTICLERYQAGETIATAKTDACIHIFHQECIMEWLKKHDKCPLCRTNIVGTNHS
jgi:hypothetical protein